MRKLLITALALVAPACGSSPGVSEESGLAPLDEQVAPARLVAAERCTAGAERPVGSRRVAYAAVVRGRTAAYARPGGTRLRTFERLNANGFPTVFGVRAAVVDERCDPTWYRVQLPVRPNGATGYVRASAVDVGRVRTRIRVDLSERTLELLRDGRPVLRAVVAVGSSATPTPTGRYYVNQRIRVDDPGGPFGPVVLGVSGFSPVLTGWAQGGPIAIHGTNDPGSIGKAVSNGCVRLPNETLRRVYDATPAGTPVVIRA